MGSPTSGADPVYGNFGVETKETSWKMTVLNPHLLHGTGTCIYLHWSHRIQANFSMGRIWWSVAKFRPFLVVHPKAHSLQLEVCCPSLLCSAWDPWRFTHLFWVWKHLQIKYKKCTKKNRYPSIVTYHQILTDVVFSKSKINCAQGVASIEGWPLTYLFASWHLFPWRVCCDEWAITPRCFFLDAPFRLTCFIHMHSKNHHNICSS